MHRSRLAGFIIDCEDADPEEAAHFWSEALGLPVVGEADDDPGYRRLKDAPGNLHVEVQSVRHPSRVHLDLRTDNVAAEARRLEMLGAKRVRTVKDWVVMEAPTGHRFCIVPARTAAHLRGAHVWK
jgi:catechol 2,3-dioxygenase-like lactoylglutathione lyase family enzyme